MVLFGLHGELDLFKYASEIVQEFMKFLLSITPNHERVVNLSQPEGGFQVCRLFS